MNQPILPSDSVRLVAIFKRDIYALAPLFADVERTSVAVVRAKTDELANFCAQTLIQKAHDNPAHFIQMLRTLWQKSAHLPLQLGTLGVLDADTYPNLKAHVLWFCALLVAVRVHRTRLAAQDLAHWLALQTHIKPSPQGFAKHFAKARFDNDMTAYSWLVALAQCDHPAKIGLPLLPPPQKRTQAWLFISIIMTALIILSISLFIRPSTSQIKPVRTHTPSQDIAIVRITDDNTNSSKNDSNIPSNNTLNTKPNTPTKAPKKEKTTKSNKNNDKPTNKKGKSINNDKNTQSTKNTPTKINDKNTAKSNTNKNTKENTQKINAKKKDSQELVKKDNK